MTNTVLTLLSSERLNEHYASSFWQKDTLYAVARGHAEHSPDRPALRDRLRRLSFSELVAAADALAADLARHGVRPGQRVAVWLPSRAETVIAMLACSRNGYVFCPAFHRDHTSHEVVKLLRRTRARVLIAQLGYGADADRHDIFGEISSLPDMANAYPLRPLVNDLLFDGLVPAASSDDVEQPNANPDSVSYLAFTSGTTGEPKGVMHSDNTLLANARAIVKDWKLDSSSVIYTMSPLSHNLGVGSIVIAILAGAELVIHDLPRDQSLLARLDEVGATYLVGVPTHAIDLLREVRANGGSSLAAVKGFRISGAAVPRAVVTELMSYGAIPQTGYGMTETCSHHYTLPDDGPDRVAWTSGHACPGFETRIWDMENPDIEVPAGTVGQIGCRGASLMLGYFDDQTATENSFNRSGWYMTGDLGSLDEAGYLKITGRAKDLIIRGGHNIHPASIETLAQRHPSVEHVAAFPVRDERLGEKVGIAVSFRSGKAAQPDEILAHLHDAGLSRYDMPEYFIQLERFPLTSSGKILKREIVAQVEDGRLTPLPVRWPARPAGSA